MTHAQRELEQNLKSFHKLITDHVDEYLRQIEELKDEENPELVSLDYVKEFYSDALPISSELDLEEKIDELRESIETLLLPDDAEDKIAVYDELKNLAERYNQGVKSEQEYILDLLRNEFGLDLVCL